MIPEHCLNVFLDGDHKKCVNYLVEFENMAPDEAEIGYREYRNKLMKSNNFFWDCARKERKGEIAHYVKPHGEVVYCTEEEIAEMYQGGMSIGDIEMEIGKSAPEIRAILKRQNVLLRPPIRMWSSLDHYRDTIVKYLDDGRLLKDIAESLNVSTSTLSGYISRRKLRELIK